MTNICIDLINKRFEASCRVYTLVSHTRSAGETYIQALNRNINKLKNNSLLSEVSPHSISY